MKRAAIVILLICVAAASAGDKEALKFPYAPDYLNKKADITNMELVCIKASTPEPKEIPLGSKLIATSVAVEPLKEYVLFKVQVRPKTPKAKYTAQDLRDACFKAANHMVCVIQKEKPGAKWGDFWWAVDLYYGDKLLARCDRNRKISTILDAKN